MSESNFCSQQTGERKWHHALVWYQSRAPFLRFWILPQKSFTGLACELFMTAKYFVRSIAFRRAPVTWRSAGIAVRCLFFSLVNTKLNWPGLILAYMQVLFSHVPGVILCRFHSLCFSLCGEGYCKMAMVTKLSTREKTLIQESFKKVFRKMAGYCAWSLVSFSRSSGGVFRRTLGPQLHAHLDAWQLISCKVRRRLSVIHETIKIVFLQLVVGKLYISIMVKWNV